MICAEKNDDPAHRDLPDPASDPAMPAFRVMV